MSAGTKIAAVLGAAALGPLTGPLALGLAGCLRARRWAMAAVYALAIAEAWTLLPLVLERELAWLLHAGGLRP